MEVSSLLLSKALSADGFFFFPSFASLQDSVSSLLWEAESNLISSLDSEHIVL